MSEVKYTEDHEWIRVDGDVGTIGITAYAAEQLGDVVFVETGEVGKSVDKGGEIGVVESVKAASEVYAPVAGEIVEVNEALQEEPAKVNESPDADGWFVKLKLADPSQLSGLMDKAKYDEYCAGLD